MNDARELRRVLLYERVNVLIGLELAERRTTKRSLRLEAIHLRELRVLDRCGVGVGLTRRRGKPDPVTLNVVQDSGDEPADVPAVPPKNIFVCNAGHGVAIPGVDGLVAISGQVKARAIVLVVNGRFHVRHFLSGWWIACRNLMGRFTGVSPLGPVNRAGVVPISRSAARAAGS